MPQADLVEPEESPEAEPTTATDEEESSAAVAVATEEKEEVAEEEPAPSPAPAPPPAQETDDPVLAALWGLDTGVSAPTVEPTGFDLDNPPEFFDEVMVDADFPEPLTTALNDLNAGIEANDAFLICGQLQRCLDLLIQHLSGVSGALVAELEPDEVLDFDLDDSRLDLDLKLELLGVCLSALESHWEVNDVATLIWSVFYDLTLPTGDPEAAYLHTRLLGVEGETPEPFEELRDFCESPPGKGDLKTPEACRLAAHRYLHVLTFWLENATALFLESDVDFVHEDTGKALSWAATVSGHTLDGTIPGLWMEVDQNRWNLPRPEFAPVYVSGDAPEILQKVVEELNLKLEDENIEEAGLFLRLSLDFLLNYFAGCAGSAWQDEGRLSPEGQRLFSPKASLDERQRLLILGLGALGSASKLGRGLGKIFARNSMQFRLLSPRTAPKGLVNLASWVSSRDPISEGDFAQYMPVLRSWVGAAASWFSAGEQLFEEPTDEGLVEGVVVYQDFYLEMVEPEYALKLPPELLRLVVSEDEESLSEKDTAAAAVLEQLVVFEPESAPGSLKGHLERLAGSLKDTPAACAWIGTSFEYLIQYFAGVCASSCFDKLSSFDVQLRRPEASLRERENLLVASLRSLSLDSGVLQQKLTSVFFEEGKPRRHTRLLGYEGHLQAGDTLLSYWCRSRHLEGDIAPEELAEYVGVLNDWLKAGDQFFSSCEHFEEDAGADGQEEIVVVYEDDFIELVHPDYGIQLPARGYFEVLYAEDDDEAAREAESIVARWRALQLIWSVRWSWAAAPSCWAASTSSAVAPSYWVVPVVEPWTTTCSQARPSPPEIFPTTCSVDPPSPLLRWKEPPRYSVRPC